MKTLLFTIFLSLGFFHLQAQTNLRKAEWFVNTDPGFHKANRINFPLNSDKVEWEFNLNNLDVGVHHLCVRVQDEVGIWSHTLTRAFLVAQEGESPIERINYRYTDERGEALQFSYTLDVPQHYIDLDFEPDTIGLIGGEEYELCFSVVTVNGAKSDERCLNFEAEGMPSSINNIEHQAQIYLYPNPTSDQLIVDFPELTQIQSWAVIDAKGSTRFRQTIGQSIQQLQLDVKELESGHYTLAIETQNILIIRNIIVQ